MICKFASKNHMACELYTVRLRRIFPFKCKTLFDVTSIQCYSFFLRSAKPEVVGDRLGDIFSLGKPSFEL